MAKLFCVSDVHGAYDQMRKALDEAGFDPNNEEHWLISCGDVWDRFLQPDKVMQYLINLPRKILVKGNHEDLFEECCDRGVAFSHDHSNGTFATICMLGGGLLDYSFKKCCNRAEVRTRVFRESMVNYFETKNYIFVHSWVPLNDDKKMENWRDANNAQWENARWGNPFAFAKQGLLPDKTLVFGHWHCSTGWAESEGRSEFGKDAKFDPFYGDGFIAIDSCVAHSKKINCTVLEDEFLTAQN